MALWFLNKLILEYFGASIIWWQWWRLHLWLLLCSKVTLFCCRIPCRVFMVVVTPLQALYRCLLQKILIFESFLIDGFCVCFWPKFKLRQRVQILRIPPGRFDAVGIPTASKRPGGILSIWTRWRNLNFGQKQTQKPSIKKDSKIKIFWSKQRYNACSGVTTTINTRQGMRQQKSVTFEHSNNQRCNRHHCHQIMLAPKYSKINLLRNHKAIFDYHFWSRCNHHQKKRKNTKTSMEILVHIWSLKTRCRLFKFANL